MLLQKLQLRMALQQLIDLLIVLSRMKRASGVNEATLRRQQRQQTIQEIFLQRQQSIDGRRRNPPASIGMASQSSEAGTGCIEEDALETTLPFGTIIQELCRIRRQSRNRTQPEPSSIGSDPLQSPWRPIYGPDFPVVVYQLRQMGALTAGSRTGIKDAITRHGLQ